MFYALISSRNEEFIDSQSRIEIQDIHSTENQSRYQNAKIIITHSFFENSLVQKFKNHNLELFTLENVLKKRNQILFGTYDQNLKTQLEIDLINFTVIVYYQTNSGIEIVSNREFDRVFTPCDEQQDQYYQYLQMNGNILPSFRQALNLNNLKNFTQSEDSSKILFQKISTNFICDQIISNLTQSVYIVSNILKDFDPYFYLQDRPYFKTLFGTLYKKVDDKLLCIYDVI